MRNNLIQEILDKTPQDIRIFTRMYADIVKRVHDLIKEKGITQKVLAERMDKKPSEVSKWLGGEHNFTLRSLAKLQAELGEPIIYVPKTKTYMGNKGGNVSLTVYKNNLKVENKKFLPATPLSNPEKPQVA
ncbi:helix-turn-helix domain-containing protein [Belliella sp. R4-6]|uniref:Helix-turn-helix domain-containing protein n=1 Tax=Belliella alkalica TaxID=1730871 RepID=A0ABS9VDR1_9BACT|nr:helix-turn-helix transcriptional regulator [Belliella alkalica]MCH7414569.1 helix-turn-helix domain-containing protein [Belliella alkalica]